MVTDYYNKKALLNYLVNLGRFRNKILDAFEYVERKDFVLDDYIEMAYHDEALPIVGNQTISQPSTVLYMLDLLDIEKGNKILEIGAGSGYNAALMSFLAGNKGKIYSVDIVDEVYRFAKKNIEKSGIKNVMIIKADGSKGYKKAAPYDRIIVTAACPKVPETLLEQLKYDGILVAPVGDRATQKMIRLKKSKRGYEKYNGKLEFRFVPLTGSYGFTQTST